ncbi:MAG: CoA transferase [Deltaproteobacteria bacterium]|nr:MAG: CoA transferase [Deltaproteobacteria bacterium]
MGVNGPLPLAGVRILAFTQLGAGPYGLMFLSDLGAEIIKVEDPTTGGDEARAVPPFNDPAARDGLYYQSLNRGARSITLNLRRPEGPDLLHRLVARVDAVYNNMRGDLPGKLGLDYAALKTANPRVVCCSLSAFGRTGPRAGDPGYDYLLQAYAGFMSATGEPDAPPTKCGVSIVDFSGGILSALALMIGLHRARATGVGCDLDVSLLDTAISMLNYMAIWTLNRDWRPQRLPEGAHQSLVPSQSFQTRDGWIVIMCMKEKFWERLVERMGLPHLREDARFRTFPDRLAHRDALRPILRAEFLRHTTAEWIERLRGHVPIAPVYAVEEALADEQVLAREMVIAVEHPRLGRLREVGCPIKIDGVAPRYAPAAPLGADTAAVLEEVGIGPAEFEEFRRRGVV